jgi:crotonobetaine/carnitine-CoA ligase
VSISELEIELQAFEGVLEAAVVAVPSDLGEMSEDDIAVFLTVAAGSGLTPERVGELATEHNSRYMRPRYIQIIDELPKTPTAKIRKDVLRKEVEGGLGAFFDSDARRAGGPR